MSSPPTPLPIGSSPPLSSTHLSPPSPSWLATRIKNIHIAVNGTHTRPHGFHSQTQTHESTLHHGAANSAPVISSCRAVPGYASGTSLPGNDRQQSPCTVCSPWPVSSAAPGCPS